MSIQLGRDLGRVVHQRAQDVLPALVGRFLQSVDLFEEGVQRLAPAGAVVQPVRAVRLPLRLLGGAKRRREIAGAVSEQKFIEPPVGERRALVGQLLRAQAAQPLQAAPVFVADEAAVQVFVDIDRARRRPLVARSKRVVIPGPSYVGIRALRRFPATKRSRGRYFSPLRLDRPYRRNRQGPELLDLG